MKIIRRILQVICAMMALSVVADIYFGILFWWGTSPPLLLEAYLPSFFQTAWDLTIVGLLFFVLWKLGKENSN